MDQLTGFERALLAQFETLAQASETSLRQSGGTARALSELSEGFGARVRKIEARQNDLNAHLQDLAGRLTEQTRQVNALIDAVNRLLDASST
jgi:ABC-type transporter Mla subunit MlaD